MRDPDPTDQPPTEASTPDGSPADDTPATHRRLRRKLPPIPWARVARATAKVGLVVALVVVVSIALGGAAFVAAGFYGQYGAVKNAPNTQAWAALDPRTAGAAACASCHAPEVQAQDATTHADVACESCHGPAATHAISEAMARATEVEEPTSVACATCHAKTAGRPSAFPQVDQWRHYRGGECLLCHDPHSVTAVRPPIVSHPLARLPECTACHAPGGLKQIPTGHEPAADPVCLWCHGKTADGLPD